MNAHWRVAVLIDTLYQLRFSGFTYHTLGIPDTGLNWSVPVPLSRARTIRGRVSMLAVTWALPNPAEEESSRSGGEIADPVEIRLTTRTIRAVGLSVWVYDRVSGDVLSKLPLIIECPGQEATNCAAAHWPSKGR